MVLNLRCQNCSESKEVECKNHSASGRIKAAIDNGWLAYKNENSMPLYFCCESCQLKFKVKTKTHLKVIG